MNRYDEMERSKGAVYDEIKALLAQVQTIRVAYGGAYTGDQLTRALAAASAAALDLLTRVHYGTHTHGTGRDAVLVELTRAPTFRLAVPFPPHNPANEQQVTTYYADFDFNRDGGRVWVKFHSVPATQLRRNAYTKGEALAGLNVVNVQDALSLEVFTGPPEEWPAYGDPDSSIVLIPAPPPSANPRCSKCGDNTIVHEVPKVNLEGGEYDSERHQAYDYEACGSQYKCPTCYCVFVMVD